MSLEWILLPAVGALIGWFTNFVAIRMLFHPRKPVRLFGRVVLQGVLPRGRESSPGWWERRSSVTSCLSTSWWSRSTWRGTKLSHRRRRRARRPPCRRKPSCFVARQHQADDQRLRCRSWGRRRPSSCEMVSRIKDRCVRSDVKLAEFVREKMSQLDTDHLERIVIKVAATELRAIEVSGSRFGPSDWVFPGSPPHPHGRASGRQAGKAINRGGPALWVASVSSI